MDVKFKVGDKVWRHNRFNKSIIYYGTITNINIVDSNMLDVNYIKDGEKINGRWYAGVTHLSNTSHRKIPSWL